VSGRDAPPVGSLTDRVHYQRREMIREDEGGHATIYVPVKMLWARVRPLSARAAFAADGRGAAASHVVVTRYRPDVKPGDRFVYRGRNLEVIGAEDLDGRRAWLSCQCQEREVTG
jgi:SPP1 family predicted phage head-tail adaptor